MIDTSIVLEGLNEPQREAVLTTEGPLLILAGAGSGKTRVITHRIALLIASGRAEPHEIVAVTFTNKAAGEMKERVARLLGVDAAGSRIGTFHALCLRILRRDGGRIGLPAGFQVYDTADQLGVLRTLMKQIEIDETAFPPRSVLSRISHAKNQLISAEQFTSRAVLPDAKVIARCYEEYQLRLRGFGAVDFDDLMVETLRLLAERSDVAERYARSCRYLLVDEYQDTNHCQYRLIRALASLHGNVCCVGDESQSIYKFRGADIQNILDFEKDYPNARLIKLEQNYRSTRTILKAASAVIEKNRRRHDKKLWTENEEGLPVHLHRSRDDRDEAEAVVRIISALSASIPTGEIAVLYRTNNQSRLIEEALVRSGVPYRIIGSLRFYERKEVKDLLAYLRLLISPGDDPSFLRTVNTPVRGLGKATLDQLGALAEEQRVPLWQAAEMALARGLLSSRAAGALQPFLATVHALRVEAGLAEPHSSSLPLDACVGGSPREQDGVGGPRLAASLSPALDRAWPGNGKAGGSADRDPGEEALRAPGMVSVEADANGNDERDGDWGDGDWGDGGRLDQPAGERSWLPIVPLITTLLRATGFQEHLERAHPGDHEERQENIEALVSAAAEYDEQQPGGGLQGFLDRSSLRSDTDDVKGNTGVTLLTVHSAKGLEFSAVVLTGLEENLFPHARSSESSEDLEEERRLFYVAVTRAKKRLVLTNAFMRRSFGDFVENEPSRFIDEIPMEALVFSESSPWSGVPSNPLALASTSRGEFKAPGRDARGDRSYGTERGAASGFGTGGYRPGGGSGARSYGSGRGYASGGGREMGGKGSAARYHPRPRDAFAGGDDYAVGRIVTHPMFGRGTILHKEGAGETLKLTIRFQSSGTKKILPRHTTLVVHD